MKRRSVLPVIVLMNLCSFSADAQDTLFYTDFNVLPSGFTPNTSDAGSTSSGYNIWIQNSSYPGGTGTVNCLGLPIPFTVPATPVQPGGINGAPNSSYMHTLSTAAQSGGISNCCFMAADGLCGSAENYFTRMSSDVSTVGYDTVTFSFWWICQGGPNSYGELYYSTDGGGSWILNSNQPKYNNNGSWSQKTITDPVWANQSTLRFGFRFVNQIATAASDPGLGIDDVLITAKNSVVLPVAAFTANDTAFCEETCLFFTDLSQNNPSAWQWHFEGAAPDTSSLQNPGQICYDDTGTFDVTLIVTNASGTDTIVYSNYITVYANPPTPAITANGDTLCTVPFMAGYQWFFNSSILIPGAVNYCYIAIFPGSYSVMITDSGGCSTFSDPWVISSVSQHSENQFGVFPNPARNSVTIVPALGVSFDRIILQDMTGKVILNLDQFKNPESPDIDLSAVPQGLYNLLVHNQGVYSATKLFINK